MCTASDFMVGFRKVFEILSLGANRREIIVCKYFVVVGSTNGTIAWELLHRFILKFNDIFRKMQSKMSPNKLICKGTRDFAAGVHYYYLFEKLSPPRFCLGWLSNFVGSESCQIQIVKLPQNMVYNRTPYPPCTLSMYKLIQYSHRKGENSWIRENVWEATVHNSGSKISAWLNVSPVHKLW
jgi:hypothetical protein